MAATRSVHLRPGIGNRQICGSFGLSAIVVKLQLITSLNLVDDAPRNSRASAYDAPLAAAASTRPSDRRFDHPGRDQLGSGPAGCRLLPRSNTGIAVVGPEVRRPDLARRAHPK